jgi:hypothetical protein
MDLMNCKKGLKVRMISKSIGCTFSRIRTKEGRIDEIHSEDGVMCVSIKMHFYLPSDLVPMDGDKRD